MRRLKKNNTMSHPVSYAYHITNCADGEVPPTWSHLKTSPIKIDYAYTDSYNGVLKNLTEQVLYFSTTFMDGYPPSRTLYPTNGQSNVHYWCVVLPLSQFNNYRIICIKIQPTQNGVNQVTLILVTPGDLILNQKVDEAIKKREVSEFTGKVNDYPYRNETTKEWRSNSYKHHNNLNAWDNIAVPHNIPLSTSTLWRS